MKNNQNKGFSPHCYFSDSWIHLPSSLQLGIKKLDRINLQILEKVIKGMDQEADNQTALDLMKSAIERQ